MIQAGTALKKNYVKNWKQQLIINWADNEKKIVRDLILTQNDREAA